MSSRAKQTDVDLELALEAAVGLVEGLGIDRSEQQMAQHLIDIFGRLLPGCKVAVRTVQPVTGQPVAVAPAGLQFPADLASPIFDDMEQSLVLPLATGERVLGSVVVEANSAMSANARQVASTLAGLLSAAVRNRRLSRDARFLRKWLATTIDSANALIFVVDAELKLTMCNRALAELLGHKAEELLEHDILRWTVVGERGGLKERIAAAFAGRSVTGCELTLVCKSGDVVPTIFNMARPADAVESVVAIGQDVTTVKVLEHQVIQAEKLASLGQLAAGVVHEINNPLTSITVYADYLIKKFRRAGCEEADVAMLERILEGSNRILKFARDLVDYGKPSVKQPDAISLNEVVQQSISFCEHVLDRAGAELTVRLGSEIPPLYGVRDQLQQVIINLLTNACHALGESGGPITVTTHAEGSMRVAVEVADAGRGIPVADLPQIFEPFFTTKTPGEGTGLGLSIVKKIVDVHNGTIMVESEEGKGTTFSILLPTGHASSGRGNG